MRPAEKIEKLLKDINIDTNAEINEAVLADVIEAFEKSKKRKPVPTEPNIWRIIMKSPIIKLAAAAVIIIAAALIIQQFGGSIDGTNAVWADVLEQVKKVKSVYYKSTTQYGALSWSNEVMIDQEGVQRIVHNNGGNVVIFDFTKGFELQLNTQGKTAYRTVRTPKPSMRLFNSLDFLASRHEKGNISFIGHEIIDGMETEVFEDIQPLQHSCTTIWINPETKLPIQVVIEETPVMDKKYFPIKHITIASKDFGCEDDRSMSGRLSGSFTPQYKKQIMTDFEWNLDLDPVMFSTEIPSGYEHLERTIPNEPSEVDLIEVLKLWVEMSDGLLPSDVNDLMNPEIMESMIIEKFKKGLNPKQEYEDAAVYMGTVRWAAVFVEKKIVIEENWHFSGETIYLGDSDAMVCWWKIEDSNDYRVIYGDLSIATVPAEQ
jgi:hypothetical protein